MNKKLLLCSSSLLLIAVASGVPACGGSTSEPEGQAGHGGFVMDSGPDTSAQDSGPEATADVAAEAKPDVSGNDVSQVDVELLEGSLFDLTMPDVSINDSGATLQGCYDCAETQCASQLSECEADDRCRTLILCFFLDGCVDPSQAMGVDLGCAMGCASKAGISNIQDPSAAMGLNVANCLSSSCPNDCGIPPEGGLPDVQVESGETDVVEVDAVDPDALYTDVMLPDDGGPAPDGAADN